jgi:hypothetical protein
MKHHYHHHNRRQNRKPRPPQAAKNAPKFKISAPDVQSFEDQAGIACKCDPIGTFAFIGCMLLAVAGFGYGLFHAIFC